jgi:hypothetical protein
MQLRQAHCLLLQLPCSKTHMHTGLPFSCQGHRLCCWPCWRIFFVCSQVCASDVVSSTLEGYNSTIMCYGQTGVMQLSSKGHAHSYTAHQQQCISDSRNLEQQQPAVVAWCCHPSIHLHLQVDTTSAASVYRPSTSTSDNSNAASSAQMICPHSSSCVGLCSALHCSVAM